MEEIQGKLQQYLDARDAFVSRVKEDRWVLAVVQIGSLNEETVWRKDGLGLWVVEADGVSRRQKSDGEAHRIWRILVEHDVNLWAEIIPRARFKRMVEGTSRTAFSYNFFAHRSLIYCVDESIADWFEEANSIATKDQQKEVMMMTCWFIYQLRYARRLLEIKQDDHRAWQALLDAAHALAATHVVMAGEICETHAMHRAVELEPSLFAKMYTALLVAGPERPALQEALLQGEGWLQEYAALHMTPVMKYLKKQRRVVSLSELANYFAYSQLHPWHLESACEWLVQQGALEKLAAEMLLTKKSRHHLEEPAYLVHEA
ncbi:MAG: hypothetical protein AAF564_05045 [Bacteroidota bacterium]